MDVEHIIPVSLCILEKITVSRTIDASIVSGEEGMPDFSPGACGGFGVSIPHSIVYVAEIIGRVQQKVVSAVLDDCGAFGYLARTIVPSTFPRSLVRTQATRDGVLPDTGKIIWAACVF